MTQPPDERDPNAADQSPSTGEPASGEAPTQAWEPAPPPDPADAAPPGAPWPPHDAAPPPPPDAATEPTWPGAQPPAPSSAEAPAPLAAGELPPSVPPPSSPIISASPSGVPPEPTGWQQPAAAGPVVNWETPGAAASAPGREGFVIAGMGARLVAYLLDALLVGIVPAILSLLVVDWTGLFDQMAASAGRTTTTTSFTMPITPQIILVSLIGLAIEFIYFVGFWTSGGQATPGMRGLKMRVVDAATGGTLSLTAATKRFIAMGYPLSLLALVPALQSVAGIGQFALTLFLFFTTVTNDRRQGLHDKWANSLVIRSTTSGDGATVVGCLLLIVVLVGFAIIASAAFFAALAPQLQEIIKAMESARPTP